MGAIADYTVPMLERVLKPHADLIYGVMRIVVGALFAVHGAQKLFGILGGHEPAVGSQAWFGGIIELVAGAAISLGLLTRWSAFLASGTMAVAYVQFHWKFRFGEEFFPVVNHGELAVVYAFLFLYIASRGAVRLGLDRR